MFDRDNRLVVDFDAGGDGGRSYVPLEEIAFRLQQLLSMHSDVLQDGDAGEPLPYSGEQ
jgi:hypothetical protein